MGLNYDQSGRLHIATPLMAPHGGIKIDELLAMNLADLAVERAMLHELARARSVRELFIVNGREPGNLARALKGENPGTRIYRQA